MITRPVHGWRPDTPDNRDRQFNHVSAARQLKALPSRVDLRGPLLPAPLDQGQLGACTAHAIGMAYEFEQRKQGLRDYQPSRLFIYYNERALEGTVHSDAGAEIRDGMKVVAKYGAPNEALWPYVEDRFTIKPPIGAYDDGLHHNCLAYQSVDVSTTAVKVALATGRPVVVGFSVYSSIWNTRNNGVIPTPRAKETLEGGHCVLVVGYQPMIPFEGGSRKVTHAIIRNSWGTGWGDGGDCYLPLAWLCNPKNADDFWSLTLTEG